MSADANSQVDNFLTTCLSDVEIPFISVIFVSTMLLQTICLFVFSISRSSNVLMFLLNKICLAR